MKQNSRKRETNQQEDLSLNREQDDTTRQMTNTSNQSGDHTTKTGKNADLSKGESTETEVSRTAEGRPGSFGIDDF
jgi:hypothetical protein